MQTVVPKETTERPTLTFVSEHHRLGPHSSDGAITVQTFSPHPDNMKTPPVSLLLGRAHSSPPDDVTYAEVTFTKLANKRGPSPRNSLPQSEYTHCTYTLVRHETGANG
ncbi:hypothetical protein EXN66_Car014078 [Channa argus]|uniref:Uncharacterized protein n=1 Tax=Channa argus TaxID=215402 RepID=A0A6G1Q7A9_CHAAH|nr:hypothetical protein EXN66_Car014078 [Channa argus]